MDDLRGSIWGAKKVPIQNYNIEIDNLIFRKIQMVEGNALKDSLANSPTFVKIYLLIEAILAIALFLSFCGLSLVLFLNHL